MSNGQAEKTILWIAAATLVLGLSAWAERKLRRTPPVDARNARPVQLTKDTKVGDKVVHGVIGLIGEFNCRPPAERFASSSGGVANDMLIGSSGNTPLVRIDSLSDALGVEILVGLDQIPKPRTSSVNVHKLTRLAVTSGLS